MPGSLLGVRLAGKVTFKTSSGEETFETGDAYYIPAGHTPVLYAGTEIIEFSPTEQWSDPRRGHKTWKPGEASSRTQNLDATTPSGTRPDLLAKATLRPGLRGARAFR